MSDEQSKICKPTERTKIGSAKSRQIVARKKRGRRTSDMPDWAPAFIKSICEGNPMLAACEVAGVTASTVYSRRRSDATFAAAWKEAQEIGTEELEAEAARRAAHGTLKPVFYKGQQCGSVREYSDTLMIFLLKARKPEMYRDQREQGQSTRVNVHVQANLDAIAALNALQALPNEVIEPKLTDERITCEPKHLAQPNEEQLGEPNEAS